MGCQVAPGHTRVGGDLVGIRWVAKAAGVDRRLGRHGLMENGWL